MGLSCHQKDISHCAFCQCSRGGAPAAPTGHGHVTLEGVLWQYVSMTSEQVGPDRTHF